MLVPVDVLDDVLEDTWRALCDSYDVTGDLPDVERLFEGAEITAPDRAAEMVLANMLAEVIEDVSRFSRWYGLPARAFGLIAIREPLAGCTRWVLAPEAAQRWGAHLRALAEAIRRNSALLQATQFVGGLLREAPPGDPCVVAACECQPPHSILIKQSTLACAEVICNECAQPFRIAEKGEC